MRRRTKTDRESRRIGERIKMLRLARGFDFDAFVEQSELSRGYVSMLERGAASPTVRTLTKVAAALELTLADLVLGGTDRERLFEACAELPAETVRRLLAEAQAASARKR